MKRYSGRRGADGQQPSGRRRLTGAQKGAILLALAVCILAVAVFALYKAVVRPVDRPDEPQQTHTVTPTETVKKPTVTEVAKQVDEETGAEVELAIEIPASYRPGVYNVLICGTDGDGLRTDTIIVAHLDVNTHTVALLSIPRDTAVPRTDGGVMKINSVYNGGKQAGMERLETRLAAMLGFEMDGYVLVDLEAFQKTVDLVGGVWFDVPQDMYYVDASQDLYIDLKQGYQLLDGEKAMHLVRFRKGYASQDIQRTKVQQDFLKALAKQCVKIGNLTKLQEFAGIFADYVTTDLTVGNMLYYGQELLKCDFDAMQSYTAEGEGMMINGLSYYPLYAGKLLSVVNASFNPYETDITLENISLITPDDAPLYQKPAEPAPEEELPAEEETPDGGEWPDGGDDEWPDEWEDEWFDAPGDAWQDEQPGGWPDTDESDDTLWEEP